MYYLQIRNAMKGKSIAAFLMQKNIWFQQKSWLSGKIKYKNNIDYSLKNLIWIYKSGRAQATTKEHQD